MAPEIPLTGVTQTEMLRFGVSTTTAEIVHKGHGRKVRPVVTPDLTIVRARIAEEKPKPTEIKPVQIPTEVGIKMPDYNVTWPPQETYMGAGLGTVVGGLVSSVRNTVSRFRASLPSFLQSVYELKLDAKDAFSLGKSKVDLEVHKRTLPVGDVWFENHKKWKLAWERLPFNLFLREIKMGAELAKINNLQPPEKRDLALYFFDLREGVRMFGEVKRSIGRGYVVHAEYMNFIDTSKSDPKALWGVDQAKARLRERDNMIANYDLVLDLLRSGSLDKSIQKWARTDGTPITPADIDNFYTFLGFLGGVDALIFIRYVALRQVKWSVNPTTGDVSITGKSNAPNLNGLVELDRQPNNIIPIRKGAGGPVSLEITDWTRGGTINAVQTWLAGEIPHQLEYTHGISFSEDRRKISQVGFVR